jgi:hypothetical protein
MTWSVEFAQGGHYAALQAPALLADDIRAFFAVLRLHDARPVSRA